VETPPAEAEAMARAIPGARLLLIPGAGHLACVEEPGAFNAGLRSFLERVDADEDARGQA
jgi:3-oxoadipate enol-lactonase